MDVHISGRESDGTESSAAQESPQLVVTDIIPDGGTADIERDTIGIDEFNDDGKSEASEIMDFAISLMAECKDGLSLSNLNTAVFLFRQVIDSLPPTHLLHTDAERDLASALAVRSMYTNQLPDLMECFTIHNETVEGSILDQETSHEANTAIILEDVTETENTLKLAKELLTDFQKSTSLHVLNDVVLLLQQSLVHLSDEPTCRFVALSTLADGLYARFNHSYDMTDLNEAISSLQDAIKCCTERDPDQQQSNIKFRICGMLAARFDLTGDISDIRTALHWLENGDIEGSKTSTGILQSLAFAIELYAQFRKSGNMADLNTAVTLFREGIAELSQESENYTAVANNLASALWSRFEQGGQRSDLDESISLHRKALALRLPPHPNQSTTLNNLANSLSTRFKHVGQRSDLDEAITLNREALALLLPSHPNRSSVLNSLASTLSTRFELGGQQRDLDEAISLHRQALALRLPPHPDRSSSLNNLACVLWIRFQQGGQPSDLNEAISLHRQALELLLPPHPDRSSSLNNLASALWTRFKLGAEQSDINTGIPLDRKSLELLLPPHPELKKRASALWALFELGGQQSDINEAISLFRQALALRLPPHPDHSLSLNNLASALSTRFEQGGQHSDINEAISLHRQALALRLPPHPDRSSSLNNLASALSTRFEKGGQPSDLNEAMSSFLIATQYFFQPASHRLIVAKRWMRSAEINRHGSAIDAYEAAIQALSQVVALSMDIKSRQEALATNSDGLALDAAKCAIRSGNIGKAIEFLEAGRSIFWSQVLSLRSPFDQLHKIAPKLADRLRDIATALETGSHRDVFAEISDNRKRLSPVKIGSAGICRGVREAGQSWAVLGVSVFGPGNVKIDFTIDYLQYAALSVSDHLTISSPQLFHCFLTHFIMAKNKPCHCQNCNGAMRAATTVKKHAAKAAEVEAENLARQEGYERERQRATSGDEDYEGNSEKGSTSSQEEEQGERPNKRRRRESPELPAEPNNYEDEIDQSRSDDEEINPRTTLNHRGPSPELDYRRQADIPFQPLRQDAIDSESEESEPPDPGSESENEEEELRARTEALNYIGQVPIIPATPDPSESDDEDFETLPTQSRIENVKLAQSFIELIKNATLDNGKLDEDTINRLRNPSAEPIDLSDPDLRFSLDLYLACMNASEATYNEVRQSILRRFPNMNILSYHLAKKEVTEISGVVSVLDDMCINSCHAFTGPYEDLDSCAICSEPRYTNVTSGRSRKKVPRQQMCTIPIGPQLQALRRSVQNAEAVSYQERKTADILKDFEILIDPTDAVYDDIFCGEDLRKFIKKLNLTSDDTTVILSLDGAQLYQNKKSDTWLAIWVICCYDPKTRFRSKHVFPAMVFPGPNKCKIMESALFRTLHHLSAIQREDNGAGIKVYSAAKEAVVSSRTVLLFATLDAVGLVDVNGGVGHHGTHGCRTGCPMKGRHKPSSGHYFAAHLKPNNCDIEDCNHPDFNFHDFTFQVSPDEYNAKLAIVIESIDQNSYEKNRKLTGISKPSILSGLHPSYILPIPLCFTNDIMHLFGLNLGELLIPIWRGTFKCEPTDDKATWDWATLVGATWQSHGKLVAAATKFFPSFFHRPPRNPAEKISSGYKASEYYLYLFGLGPGFFRAVLPKKYWKNFCKLVRGVQIIMQRKITGKQVQEAHSCLIQFVEEYEHIYYQRRMDRLHFARPCLHTLLHTAPEVLRVGNGCLTDQYTMERAIGELGKGIRQPSNPYGNLCQLALRRAQANALKSTCPELDREAPHLPRYAQDLGDAYVLLRPREKLASRFSEAESEVIKQVCDKEMRQKWGRLQLPSGQTVRSLFSEKKRASGNIRISRNVKINLEGQLHFAEVQYFFLDRDNDEPGEQVAYVVLSLYGPPNQEMLVESSYTLHACEYTGQGNLLCLPVTVIDSVVSMQPLPPLPGDPENLWFVVEKSGLNDVQLVPYGEDT